MFAFSRYLSALTSWVGFTTRQSELGLVFKCEVTIVGGNLKFLTERDYTPNKINTP